MAELVDAVSDEDLNRRGFRLYEQLRPTVPPGETGWGAKGVLDLDRIWSAAPG
jgi:hypothetical protein